MEVELDEYFMKMIVKKQMTSLLVPVPHIGVYGYKIGKIIKYVNGNKYVIVKIIGMTHHFDFRGAYYSHGSCFGVPDFKNVSDFVKYFNNIYHYPDEDINNIVDKESTQYIKDTGGCMSLAFYVVETNPNDYLTLIDEEYIFGY